MIDAESQQSVPHDERREKSKPAPVNAPLPREEVVAEIEAYKRRMGVSEEVSQ